jgi:hypothetical protein
VFHPLHMSALYISASLEMSAERNAVVDFALLLSLDYESVNNLKKRTEIRVL